MARDFANRNKHTSTKRKPTSSPRTSIDKPTKRKSNTRKRSTPKKRAPLWLWLIAFIAIVGFAIFLTQINNSETPDLIDDTHSESAAITDEADTSSQVRFDFYEILKEHEVKVDARVLEKTPEKSNIIYWLQVASFKQANDADQMRVKLLLLNLDASVEKTLNKEQQEWHRVMIGPFKSRSRLAKARSILASNEINSILIKRKNEP